MRLNHIRYSFLFCAIIAVSVFSANVISPTVANAQEESGVKIQPSIIEEKVEPGDQISGLLNVTNVSSARQTYFVSKRNISGVGPDGQPQFDFVQDETGLQITSWITLGEEVIVLDPGQRKSVSYSINVPADAPPGGHFGGIFLSLRNDDVVNQGASIGFQVGSILNLQVGGDIVEDVQIREFSTDRSLYTRPDVMFSANVINLGNVLARPRGTIQIENFSGDVVGTLIMNESAAGIVPGTSRAFEAEWNDDKLRIGKYNVFISVIFGQEVKRTVSQTLSFWVIPTNVVLPVLGGLIAVFLIFYISIKLHIRRVVKKAGGRTTKVVYRDRATASRLAVILIALLSFTIIFLIILFLFLA